jgi:hypothetical protein
MAVSTGSFGPPTAGHPVPCRLGHPAGVDSPAVRKGRVAQTGEALRNDVGLSRLQLGGRHSRPGPAGRDRRQPSDEAAERRRRRPLVIGPAGQCAEQPVPVRPGDGHGDEPRRSKRGEDRVVSPNAGRSPAGWRGARPGGPDGERGEERGGRSRHAATIRPRR